MLVEALQERLGKINRERSGPTVPPPVEGVAGRQPTEPPEATLAWAGFQPVTAPAPAVRSAELPAGHEVVIDHGRLWEIRSPLVDWWPAGPAWLQEAAERPAPANACEELRQLARHVADGALLLDLETCGFAGSMVFLTGVIRCQNGQATVHQLLARDYSEERAMLERLWELGERCQLLVTFNGKSFDWPSVCDRMVIHRVAGRGRLAAEDTPHCDLLHHCRRRWKTRLPDCKLQTLERHFCRRERRDDIPGRDIPDAYHDYVRTNDAWQIRRILHHNALDLVTLLQLSIRLLHPDQ